MLSEQIIRPSSAGVLIEALRRLKKDFFSSYRPELYYMRGPGPRWRAKHALRLAPVAVNATRVAPRRARA
jgi:hypothetical protein